MQYKQVKEERKREILNKTICGRNGGNSGVLRHTTALTLVQGNSETAAMVVDKMFLGNCMKVFK